ncbi:hypothetical protein SLEP1_g43774 [Rubroshorea leprosula]|uniref:Transposase-associated domain-containing protein n=1 Tax=Rubroshorea leprosula TaxID=152421 RepID=A0AAV5LF50_9ROSI|nr:hypothetical protein SLEP1_g43774 [Rubroshorea leprosula]
MDKSWISLEKRKSLRYERGALGFIEFASKQQTKDGKIKCPCTICGNVIELSKEEVFDHIICKGFLRGYVHWVWHGEGIGSSTTSKGVSHKQEVGFQHDLHGLLNDAKADMNVDPVDTSTGMKDDHGKRRQGKYGSKNLKGYVQRKRMIAKSKKTASSPIKTGQLRGDQLQELMEKMVEGVAHLVSMFQVQAMHDATNSAGRAGGR